MSTPASDATSVFRQPRARRGRRRALRAIALAAIIGVSGTGCAPASPPPPGRSEPPASRERTSGPEGGELPGGADAFDDSAPGIGNLESELLSALQAATLDAAAAGIELKVNSGWRSPDEQNTLLEAAVAEYGSQAEAVRWVATAETSAHVSGEAVDVGQMDAVAWLSEHGAAYGLCQIYGNESWHFEFRPDAPLEGCPPQFRDPSEDPRMHP